MIKSGDIGIISAINNDELSLTIMDKAAYFDTPVNSQLLGIHKVRYCGRQITVTVNQFHSKMMLIPKKYFFIAIKILHTNN
jgi:hypothetical protein